MELYHHGIPGQQWGVRNGPPYPINRITRKRDANAVNDIYKTLSKDDKRRLMGGDSPSKFTTQEDYNKTVATFILKHKDTPVSAFDVWSEDDGTGKYKGQVAVSVLTRSGKDYRQKGYASKAVKRGMDWLDNNPEIKTVYWDVRRDNAGSIALAKKHGFKEMPNTTDPEWTAYWKRYKRTKK